MGLKPPTPLNRVTKYPRPLSHNTVDNHPGRVVVGSPRKPSGIVSIFGKAPAPHTAESVTATNVDLLGTFQSLVRLTFQINLLLQVVNVLDYRWIAGAQVG